MKKLLDNRLVVQTGDITKTDYEVIVNAANSSLLGGGGVDGAIHRAAGPDLLAECRRLRETTLKDGLPTGEAVATDGYRLAAKHVVHTVGPVWRGGDAGEKDLLASAYRRSLETARELGAESIAFPAISTGVYRFPRDLAASIAFDQIKDFLSNNALPKVVALVFFSQEDMTRFLGAVGEGT